MAPVPTAGHTSQRNRAAGVGLLMVIGFFGLLGFGALGFWAGAVVGGSWVGVPLLAWPGLFLSLGWNFLEFGISPPEAFGGGPEWAG